VVSFQTSMLSYFQRRLPRNKQYILFYLATDVFIT
jgi:hypothetical protein